MKLTQKLTIVMIFIIIFIYLFYNYFSLTNLLDKQNYEILLFSFVICGFLFLLTILKKDYYIFEPYTLVSLLYLVIMIYRPCQDILRGDYYRFNIFIMNGCTKATLIFTLSFIIYTIAYNIKIKPKGEIKTKRIGTKISNYSDNYNKKVRNICLLIYICGLVSAIVYLLLLGKNPMKILLNISQETSLITNNNFKFLGKVEYIMIIPWIYIVTFDRNKLLKLITTFCMFFIFLTAGFRYIIVVSILAIIILPYISEKKSFSFRKGLILFIILLTICNYIGGMRGTIRAGKSVDFEELSSVVEITDVFDSDLTIYKPFYCVVENIPSVMPYQMGRGLIGYSIISFLPRSLFPWKKNFETVQEVVLKTMNENAMKAGLAMPNIAEYYWEFGIYGCIICMFLFGIVCKRMKSLYMFKRNSLNEIVLYSVLMPFLMQIVCRGYLSTQLNSLLFIVLPYFVLKKHIKASEKVEV